MTEQPGHTTPARIACELTGTRLDPNPDRTHCWVCGERRDRRGLPGCLNHRPPGYALRSVGACDSWMVVSDGATVEFATHADALAYLDTLYPNSKET